MLDEYRRRALTNPEGHPELKVRAAMKSRALFTTARFLAGCRAVGFIDEEWAAKRYTELTPQLQSAVSAPHAVSYVMNECNNTLNYSRNEKRRSAQTAYDAIILATIVVGLPRM